MKSQEIPPRDENGEIITEENLKGVEVESFEDSEKFESISAANIEDQKIREAKERMGEETGYKLSIEDQIKIKEIKDGFINPDTTARDQITSTALKRPLGDESYTAYQGSIPSNSNRNWGRAGKFFTAIIALFGGHQASATDINKEADNLFVNRPTLASNEKDPSDSTKNIKSEKTFTDSSDAKKAGKIGIYTQSKTREGAITPTGLNNSFYENKFGITEADIEVIAQKYGLSTESEASFQAGLVDYMAEHHPDVIEGVMKEFGSTNKGAGLEGLKDTHLGARTAFMMGLLKNGSAELTIDGKKITYSTATPDSLEGGPNPSGGETFNTDGYQKLVVLFDNSPSMYKHRAFLAGQLGSNTSDVDVEVLAFSNKVDAAMTFPTPKDASRELAKINIVDQNSELAIDVLAEKLQSMDVQQGKTKIVVCTDEALQSVRAEKLAEIQKLSTEKNIDVTFSVIINEIPYTLTLEDVQESYKTVIDGFTKSIELREKQIQEFQAQLKDATGKKSRDIEKQIKQNQEEIAYYVGFLNGNKQINLDTFEKDQTTKSIASN